MKYRNTDKYNEQGFASIVVALTIIIVLGLLAVGFSQLARREQQSALDKQLNTQAYYAAETGINDTKKYLSAPGADTAYSNLNTEQCVTGPSLNVQNPLPGDSGASYNCVIANTRPPSLEYKQVPAGTSKVVNFKAVNSAGARVDLTTLKIEWESAGNIVSGSGKAFTPNDTWGNKSVIQFSLTPYLAAGATGDTLRGATINNYFYPNNQSDTNVNYPAALSNQGEIIDGSCIAATNKCTVTITGIPAGFDNYLVHFINMYKQSNITITGTSGTDTVQFEGGQAMIDVTGKARNVLKRLRVRVPLDPKAEIPGYSIEAQNICKRIETDPNTTVFRPPTNSGGQQASCTLDD